MVLLPAPFSSIPRHSLLYEHLSPIEPLSRLTEILNRERSNVCNPKLPKFWIDREDSNSGLAAGGNKIRKLEYVVPDALAQGATVLVTTGGLQSNHMRQVAAAATKLGLKSVLIPQDRNISTKQEYHSLGNIQIISLLGAGRTSNDAPFEKVLQDLKDQGEVPYWIPSGASTHPLGGCGYARWAFEIGEWENENGVFFDAVVVPCNSGSTLAGMIAGFKLLERGRVKGEEEGRRRKVFGIDTSAIDIQEMRASMLNITRMAAKAIGLEESGISEVDVSLDDRWNAGSYGAIEERTTKALRMMASVEGILVDPVYTGKACAGMIGMTRLGELDAFRNVLFVHTSGVIALSAYPEIQ